MAKEKISMLDIAKLADVSVATVSRILNKNGRYSIETEQRVMELVKKYGYQVNQNAKSLRTNKTHSIGVIVPDITNEFFAKIIRSIEVNIIPHGYTVFVCDSNESEEMEDFHIASLVAKDVDGIIYNTGKSDVEQICKSFSIPVVYIDRRPVNAGTLVISDNEMGGYLATECLIKAGCKKILMLHDFRDMSPVRHRLRGYTNAHRKYSLPIDTSLFVAVNVDYNDAKRKIQQLIDDGVEFDGVFTSSDMIALGAMHGAIQKKKKVPKDIKFVGFDGITITEICNPTLSTIEQDTQAIGRTAVEALLALIESGKEENQKFTIPVKLIERQTTAIS